MRIYSTIQVTVDDTLAKLYGIQYHPLTFRYNVFRQCVYTWAYVYVILVRTIPLALLCWHTEYKVEKNAPHTHTRGFIYYTVHTLHMNWNVSRPNTANASELWTCDCVCAFTSVYDHRQPHIKHCFICQTGMALYWKWLCAHINRFSAPCFGFLLPRKKMKQIFSRLFWPTITANISICP